MATTSMSVNTATANIHPNGSQSSLPDSPTSILAGTKSGKKMASGSTNTPYSAPPIPKTFRDSVGAYFRKSDSAAPELYLYRHSGYFQGATLQNAPNADLMTAFKAAQSHSLKMSQGAEHPAQQSGDARQHLEAALQSQQSVANNAHTKGKDRATVGTELNSDGKVGSIRLVDIGSTTSSGGGFASWFTSATPRMINMLEIGTLRPVEEVHADENEEKVVLLHGYGAGTAFFFQNLKSLAKHPDSRLYALDWLGMGRSSRVPFHITSKQAKTTETRVEAAESFFVQALEDWRQTMGLKKITLVGHSLGGYLSVAYSLKYPQNVNRLVLLSPAGIPEAPEEAKSDANNPPPRPADRKDADKIAAEVQQSQQDVAPDTEAQRRLDADRTIDAASATKRRGSNDVSERIQTIKPGETSDSEEATGNPPKPPPKRSSRTRNMVQFLWEANLSPFAILRTSTIFGPMLAGGYTSRRFASLPDEDLRALHAYCYDVFTSRGSSEYCLAHILAPFGFARMPMVHRISALPKTLPVTFIYGERGIDWMDESGGNESVKALAKAGNPHARCFAVPHSGHHVYLDNPRAFDTLLGRVLRGQADDAGKAGSLATQG
ncbi:alpha/beta-hydrolase [Meira miltonrushii]|uniref:Alpha/beta-hydrolase n=1 Tax=Meira miltonrushii TaxID=1280837 RepID=A0A316VDP7_9BASI|nr:alpha/beta-hydrolase [Meira miltonrushii]PWN34121.1 alpha/beta-hydrolase [Meira miltonrushii]